jgi:hypothetical protein
VRHDAIILYGVKHVEISGPITVSSWSEPEKIIAVINGDADNDCGAFVCAER